MLEIDKTICESIVAAARKDIKTWGKVFQSRYTGPNNPERAYYNFASRFCKTMPMRKRHYFSLFLDICLRLQYLRLDAPISFLSWTGYEVHLHSFFCIPRFSFQIINQTEEYLTPFAYVHSSLGGGIGAGPPPMTD